MRRQPAARLLGTLLVVGSILHGGQPRADAAGAAGGTGAGAAAGPLAAEGLATMPIHGHQGVTVTVPLAAPMREALARAAGGPAGAAPTVRLAVEGIEPPAAATPAVGVRVFLDAPRVDAATPIDDPHYVGSFTFFDGRGGAGAAPAKTAFLLDLGHTLRALGSPERWLRGGDATVTLVAVPLHHGESVEGVSIPFEKVRISLHPRS
jgi:hypothetical protein